jgi:hypothetical protein
MTIRKAVSLLLAFCLALLVLSVSGCDTGYGQVGGADTTVTIEDPPGMAGIVGPWHGVWYSHYGNRKLDSYRIGKWSEIKNLLGASSLCFRISIPIIPNLRSPADGDHYQGV